MRAKTDRQPRLSGVSFSAAQPQTFGCLQVDHGHGMATAAKTNRTRRKKRIVTIACPSTHRKQHDFTPGQVHNTTLKKPKPKQGGGAPHLHPDLDLLRLFLHLLCDEGSEHPTGISHGDQLLAATPPAGAAVVQQTHQHRPTARREKSIRLLVLRPKLPARTQAVCSSKAQVTVPLHTNARAPTDR